jgi:hypothetical protein
MACLRMYRPTYKSLTDKLGEEQYRPAMAGEG